MSLWGKGEAVGPLLRRARVARGFACARRRARRALLCFGVAVGVVAFPAVAGATMPGHNGRIAFTRDDTVGSVLPDGTGFQVIAKNNPAHGDCFGMPAYAPGGDRLALAGCGDFGMYFGNADGSDLKGFVVSAADVVETPSWSRGGGRLVFTGCDGDDENCAIYRMRSDGTGERRLASGYQGAWGSGGRIAYTGPDLPIVTMNANGKRRRRVPHTTSHDGLPDWSPNGRRLTFTRFYEDTASVFVIDANGRHRRLLARRAVDSVWSPDGTKLAFARLDTDPETEDDTWNIYTVNADGSAIQRVAAGLQPDWQPLR